MDQTVRGRCDARAGLSDAVGEVPEGRWFDLLGVAGRELDEKLHAKGETSDLVQDTFLEARRCFSGFQGETKEELLAWSHGLLRNTICRVHRRYRETTRRASAREVGGNVATSCYNRSLSSEFDRDPRRLVCRNGGFRPGRHQTRGGQPKMGQGGQQADLSGLLEEAKAGVEGSRDRLIEAMYGELRRMAGDLMRRERPGHTLQPSALVNEAVIRILNAETLQRASDRRYLFAAAAQAMRRTLVDYARKPKATGPREAVHLDRIAAGFEEQHLDILALNEAIDRLTAIDERRGLVVILKYFGGLTIPEVAGVLDVSEATVEGDWRFARAWLRAQLGGGPG